MQTDNIVEGWLNGSDSVNGYANPAGPLYTEGHAVTIAAITNTDIALVSHCSSCTASRPGLCC
ncbi:DUF6229 family protein [Dyella silvae]|uniref:DUF6229 family protein n=1 Tax=Dyella silvae TaxID=2994424 RepID=UPI002263DA28|nr:DUF6229 family protein [Dyella silvae]